jgi:hypothetical protein
LGRERLKSEAGGAIIIASPEITEPLTPLPIKARLEEGNCPSRSLLSSPLLAVHDESAYETTTRDLSLSINRLYCLCPPAPAGRSVHPFVRVVSRDGGVRDGGRWPALPPDAACSASLRVEPWERLQRHRCLLSRSVPGLQLGGEHMDESRVNNSTTSRSGARAAGSNVPSIC